MGTIEHRLVVTNGIRMHIAEQGHGPLVILCHGFPETWFSWRHQIGAIADSGWHVVAPDQRGYGRTDSPHAVDAYDILSLTADIVGLVHALGQSNAAIIGNDWGSVVAAHCGLQRPDIFKAVGLLSVPYIPRGPGKHRPTEIMRRVYRNKQFYQLYVQEPGKPEAELERDVRKTLLMMLYSLSGDVSADKRWRYLFEESETLLDTGGLPERLPGWLPEQDLSVFVEDFERTGFRGGLNWYRNIDRNWELTAPLTDAAIRQPSFFLAGELDPLLPLYRNYRSILEQSMPNLKSAISVKGKGHWAIQEDPEFINRAFIEFLVSNYPVI